MADGSVAISHPPLVGDFDGEGRSELILSDNNRVVMLDGLTGRLLRRLGQGHTLAVGELFGTAQSIVVAAPASSRGIAAYDLAHGMSKQLWKSKEECHTEYMCLGDLRGTGHSDVIMACWESLVYAIRGTTGSGLWAFHTRAPVNASFQVGTLRGKAGVDVVVPDMERTVYALQGFSGELMWWFSLPEGEVGAGVAIADIDGDGHNEVIVTSAGPRIYALAGSSGRLIWSSALAVPDGLMNPSVADLLLDGTTQIITAAARGNAVFVVDGKTGRIIASNAEVGVVTAGPLVVSPGTGLPSEIVVGCEDGRVFCLQLCAREKAGSPQGAGSQ